MFPFSISFFISKKYYRCIFTVSLSVMSNLISLLNCVTFSIIIDEFDLQQFTFDERVSSLKNKYSQNENVKLFDKFVHISVSRAINH